MHIQFDVKTWKFKSKKAALQHLTSASANTARVVASSPTSVLLGGLTV